jgi:hypothetical protein
MSSNDTSTQNLKEDIEELKTAMALHHKTHHSSRNAARFRDDGSPASAH